MRTKIAFYKVQKGDPWGNTIAWWTGLFNPGTPKYVHVEVQIGDSWYSSASRNADGTTGTRWISEEALFKNPERWDIYEIEINNTLEGMQRIADNEVGKKYDWWGVAGFATVFGLLNAKGKWYCSEICNYVLFRVWKRRISPIGLFAKLKGGGYVVV